MLFTLELLKYMQKSLLFNNKILIFLQFTLLAIVAIILGLINGWLGLKSALLGGIAWIIPSLYFAWNLNKVKTLFDTKKMLKCFFLSGAIKMLLCVTIIALILMLFTISKLAFLCGFVSVVFASVIASFWQGAKNGAR